MKLKTKLSTLLLGITSIFALTAAIVTNPNSGNAIEAKAEAVTTTVDGSKLISTATTKDTTLTFDGIDLVFSKGAKKQASNGTNAFTKDGAILIGQSGAYIYNTVPFGNGITSFEIYANAGASTKVTIGVNFSENPINSYDSSLSSTYTSKLSTLNSVYDASSVIPSGAKYFFYQVTNSNNSQVQFKIGWDKSESSSVATLQSITATSTQKEVYQNAELDKSAITVTGYYDVGSPKVLSSGWTVECDTSVVATGVTATVTHTETNKKATFTVDVVESEKYSLVTDITQIVEGSKIIIAGEINNEVYAAVNYASGNNIPAKKATLQDGKIVKTDDIAAMTIGTCSNGYTIQDENNLYLYCASSETKSYLKGQTKIVDNSYWSISYSSGKFSIIAHKSTGTTRNILRLNSASNLFNCYASGQNDVKLYVLNPEPTNTSKLETFGRLYLNSYENPLVTSETGVDGTSCRNLYLVAKKALSGAWSCIKTDLQNDTTGLALRYEAWARANGDQTPYDGNEAIVNMLNLRATLTNSQSTESSIALVVVIAVISLSSICCYFALNRKKEQK